MYKYTKNQRLKLLFVSYMYTIKTGSTGFLINMQRFERECFWERMIEVYLFAQFHTYCIGLFEEDSISPQIIPE